MNIAPLSIQSIQPDGSPIGAGDQAESVPKGKPDDRSLTGAADKGSQTDEYVPSSLARKDDAGHADAISGSGTQRDSRSLQGEQAQAAGDPGGAQPVQSRNAAKGGTDTAELSPEEKAKVDELKRRDTEVRRHEQAHVAAAGRYARGGANFQYVLGPDGKLYAVGGEVQIDTSEVPDDPQATIQKAQTVRRAALAPSNPSSQDQRVAAAATQMEFEARMELVRERTEEAESKSEGEAQGEPGESAQPKPLTINLFA